MRESGKRQLGFRVRASQARIKQYSFILDQRFPNNSPPEALAAHLTAEQDSSVHQKPGENVGSQVQLYRRNLLWMMEHWRLQTCCRLHE
ncbi:peroxisome biogenesis factor 2 isoform X4 [Rhineura floridana]|uniref:peroxisome biogenesis factor 2 isoform X4 n=1 Tax=Rhineura floridana TaxID=261503 RepID=UPI002AC875EB|nr:peroxisome biogenesis factor 2 isoform X4 [Rhineura floridana]